MKAGRIVPSEQHDQLFRKYCLPDRRYKRLLSVSFANSPGGEDFAAALIRDAQSIPDADLDTMLAGDWREQLVAYWLIGYARKISYASTVHEHLESGALRHTGKGIFFTLARFCREEDGAALHRFLVDHLHPTSVDSYQPWALGALMLIEKRLSRRDLSADFTKPKGGWEKWSSSKILEDRSAEYWAREVERWVNLANSADRK